MNFGRSCYPCDIKGIVDTTDELTDKTVEKVSETQELVMVNNFAKEASETLLKKCLQDRISDIASWRWVLEDLVKRLDASIGVLQYELKAAKVVNERLKEEIFKLTKNNSQVVPQCRAEDSVEDALREEFSFLRAEKKLFESLLSAIEAQIANVTKTKERIEHDVLMKTETLELEENVISISIADIGVVGKKSKKRPTSLASWENRCRDLKRDGLRALSKTLVTRQQARGARIELTITSQALANKVDLALRRRMHYNHSKLLELDWQRQETMKDLEALGEEMATNETSLLKTMEQETVIEARLADRSHRPNGEMTRDEVDRKLRDELARVRRFIRDLRANLEEINSLQNHLKDQLVRMDCVAEDILAVLSFDEERMQRRSGSFTGSPSPPHSARQQQELNTIKEEYEDVEVEKEELEIEEEEDDYPFAD